MRPFRFILAAMVTMLPTFVASPALGAVVDSTSDDDAISELSVDGIVALQAEVLVLVALDGFAQPVPAALIDVYDEWSSYTAGTSREGLIDWLTDVDTDGARALDALVEAGATPGTDIGIALGRLPDVSFEALEAGAAEVVDPTPYVAALVVLDAATLDASRISTDVPPSGDIADTADTTVTTVSPAEAGTAANESTAARPVEPVVGTTLPQQTSDPVGTVPDTGDRLGLVVIGGAVLMAAAVAGLAFTRRRRSGNGDGFDRLLEAGRRMTRALERSEIARIARTEAMELVEARHGAFVACTPTGMEIIDASADVFDARRLQAGLLQRISETGQPANLVSQDEPALTALPAAILAVPVIGGGRVTGIIMLIRPDRRPFDAAEETLIGRLAPMVGSALAAAEQHDDISSLSFTDPLTGLANRRALGRDIAVLRDGVVAVTMIDVDHFKNFNDTNGHGAGDEALRTVGRTLSQCIRASDRAYRYGGEEFTLIARVKHADEATELLERVREAVEQAPVAGEQHQPGGRLTISVGVAIAPASEAGAALAAADAALYTAKESGRNRVVVTDLVLV
jgi:diguanylate cyclase (GGDEF)-like protein